MASATRSVSVRSHSNDFVVENLPSERCITKIGSDGHCSLTAHSLFQRLDLVEQFHLVLQPC
jgi:hypothetical protein